MKISVLTPSFNSVKYIRRSIESVLNQGYSDFEHIIVDGGSTDGTIDILKEYPHLKWISEKDKGQSDAMNKAFDMSLGDIIVYLNADDYFFANTFCLVVNWFNEFSEADMIVGNILYEYADETGKINNSFVYIPTVKLPKNYFPFRFPSNSLAYFYKRSLQIKVGKFHVDNHYAMDLAFILRAFQIGCIVKVEHIFGSFWNDGSNKTSIADSSKHIFSTIILHCQQYDKKKNLLFRIVFFYYIKLKPLMKKFKTLLKRFSKIQRDSFL